MSNQRNRKSTTSNGQKSSHCRSSLLCGNFSHSARSPIHSASSSNLKEFSVSQKHTTTTTSNGCQSKDLKIKELRSCQRSCDLGDQPKNIIHPLTDRTLLRVTSKEDNIDNAISMSRLIFPSLRLPEFKISCDSSTIGLQSSSNPFQSQQGDQYNFVSIDDPLSARNTITPTAASSLGDSPACTTDRSDRTFDIEILPAYARHRRTAVSSESVNIQSMNDWTPPIYPKSMEEGVRIAKAISSKLNVLFGCLSPENEGRVLQAMFKVKVPKGISLIKQGDPGDNFYIVDQGKFDILVSRPGFMPTRVLEATPGMSFGELALMYNSPRAATCIATEDSIVWALDRSSFRMLLVTAECLKKKRYESLLEKVEIFKSLTKYERSQLSDILVVQDCEDGECIIRQGEKGDRFYIVESGELVCKIHQHGQKELEVHRYNRGGYFGEVALIEYGIRRASVYSVGNNTRLLWIGKSTFDRVLGPLKNQMLKDVCKHFLKIRQLRTIVRVKKWSF